MGNIVGAIIFGIIAILCFVFGYLQFNEKGFLLNNAYIHVSQKERETMDKKPLYKQSGIVILMIGMIFLINVVEMILKTGWLFYLAIVVAIIEIVYAIVSTIVIERIKNRNLVCKSDKSQLQARK